MDGSMESNGKKCHTIVENRERKKYEKRDYAVDLFCCSLFPFYRKTLQEIDYEKKTIIYRMHFRKQIHCCQVNKFQVKNLM